MSIKAVLDANVIYPASIRDTLLRAAHMGLYQILFTDNILEEVRRNLVKNIMPDDKALRLITIIKEEFDEGLIPSETYESCIAFMPVNEKDRYVLAVAVACKADVIVTQNLKHFPKEQLVPYAVQIQSPDEFLTDLLHTYPESIAELLIKQAGSLRRPSRTVPEILNILKIHAPNFVELAQKELGFRKTDLPLLDSVEIGNDIHNT